MGFLDSILGAAGGDWRDRVQEAAYTSPSGKRLAFEYLDTPSSIPLLTQASNFPGVNGTFVQSLGYGGDEFKIDAIFTGANSDLGRKAFADLLLEPGVGKLEHPTRGTFDVVPTGTVEFADDVAESGNVFTVSVTFSRTLVGAWPTTEVSVEADLVSAFDQYNAAQAALFADQLDVGAVSDMQQFLADYRSTMRTIRGTMREVAMQQEASARSFDQLYRDLSLGVDTLVTQPANLMFAQQQLIAMPGAMLRRVGATARASFDLARSVVSGYGAFLGQARKLRKPSDGTRYPAADLNSFAANDHAVGSAISTAAVALLDVGYQSRDEALSIAAQLITLVREASAWRDEEVTALGYEPNETWAQVVDLATRAAGRLVQVSFSLAQKRSIELDRDRTPLDLVAELYGDLERLDEWCNMNSLGTEDQLLLRRGRRVEYLVQ